MSLSKQLLDNLSRTEPSEFEEERVEYPLPEDGDEGFECDGTNCPPRAHDHKVLL